MPPLWLTIETTPGRNASSSCRAVAKVEVAGSAVLITPTQLGPHKRNPVSRHKATRARCRSMPSPPASARPPA